MAVETYVCPRCGTPAVGASECSGCGLDLDAQPELPTAEEYAAGGVDAAAERRRAEAEQEEATARTEEGPRFKSPRVRGQVFQLWIVGGALVDLTWGILSVIHLGLLEDGAYDDPAKLEKLEASDDRLLLPGVAAVVVFLVTSAFFIAWFNRAYKNLPALGCHDRRWGTGWTVGAWFIPIAAWIIPKQIADDIWRCSVERDAPREVHWRRRRIPVWVHVWWGLYILGSFLGNVSFRIYGDGENIDDERTSTLIDIVSVPLWLASAVLVWLFVERVSRAQDAAAGAPPVTDPPPPRP